MWQCGPAGVEALQHRAGEELLEQRRAEVARLAQLLVGAQAADAGLLDPVGHIAAAAGQGGQVERRREVLRLPFGAALRRAQAHGVAHAGAGDRQVEVGRASRRARRAERLAQQNIDRPLLRAACDLLELGADHAHAADPLRVVLLEHAADQFGQRGRHIGAELA